MSVKIKLGEVIFPKPVPKPAFGERSFELTIPGNHKFYFADSEAMNEAHKACSSIMDELAEQLLESGKDLH